MKSDSDSENALNSWGPVYTDRASPPSPKYSVEISQTLEIMSGILGELKKIVALMESK